MVPTLGEYFKISSKHCLLILSKFPCFTEIKLDINRFGCYFLVIPSSLNESMHFCRIRDGGGAGRPPPPKKNMFVFLKSEFFSDSHSGAIAVHSRKLLIKSRNQNIFSISKMNQSL